MKDTIRIYFNIARLLSLVFGILFCITIVGAIFGIPMIIASNKFKDALSMTDEQLVANRGSILGWGIFLAIVFSPTFVGLILLLIMTFMVDNYIRNIEQGEYQKNQKSFADTIEDGASTAWQNVKNTFKGSDVDKQRQELEKLEKMRNDGLITREEYETMRKKILGL